MTIRKTHQRPRPVLLLLVKGYNSSVGLLCGLTSIALKITHQNGVQVTEGKAMIFLSKHFPSATQKHYNNRIVEMLKFVKGFGVSRMKQLFKEFVNYSSLIGEYVHT